MTRKSDAAMATAAAARRLALYAGALFTGGLYALASMQLDGWQFEGPFVGLVEGTTLGLGCAAAIWGGAGPGKAFYRVPLSLAMIGAAAAARAISVQTHELRPSTWQVWPIGFSLAAIWIAAQLYFLSARLVFGLQLVHVEEEPVVAAGGQDVRLTIRDLLLLMLFIALPLAIYQLMAGIVPFRDFRDLIPRKDEIVVALCAVMVGLLLTQAILARRYGLLVAFFLLVAIALWSLWEDSILFHYRVQRQATWFDQGALWSNGVFAAWCLAFALIARGAGFRLARRGAGRIAAAVTPPSLDRSCRRLH